jgi:dTDP-4-dehydrorhamnose 3,5-epimerase
MDLELPEGVSLFALKMNRDSRGIFTEVYRESWLGSIRPLQWSLVSSDGNVLRGVHVHRKHSDYLIHIRGNALLALRDLRKGSPTEGLVSLLEATESRLEALLIPPGVAHGFYFREPSTQILAVTEYWNPADEVGCHYADPALKIPWPSNAPILSERDRSLPPLSEILDQIPPWRPSSQRVPGPGD